jgi:hypothetical protein
VTDTCAGNYFRGKAPSLSVVAASWCFVAFVFVNVYNSMLTSTLATSYKAPEINSVQQLADSPTYQMTTLKGILPDIEIMVTDFIESERGINFDWLSCPIEVCCIRPVQDHRR